MITTKDHKQICKVFQKSNIKNMHFYINKASVSIFKKKLKENLKGINCNDLVLEQLQ